jgi:hypothetical protein
MAVMCYMGLLYLCSAVRDLISETPNKKVENSTSNYCIRIYTKTLFSYVLY